MPSEPANIAFGAVVLVPFPFTDQATSKRRPAVVISSANYHASRPDVILMAITSQLRASAAFGEVWLKEWQAAGLLKPSAVKPVVATFARDLIIRQLGNLAEDDAKALRAVISELIG
jgi:mRNA interferase MazF